MSRTATLNNHFSQGNWTEFRSLTEVSRTHDSNRDLAGQPFMQQVSEKTGADALHD